MNFGAFIEWAFLGVTTGGVWILWLMHQSVNELNTKIAVLIAQHEQTTSDIKDHEGRIRNLEKQ